MNEPEPRAHRVALEYIESAILGGELPVGTRLPPERELAAQLGVSRGAVREAIRELQAQGILESLPGPGRGTRITPSQSQALGRMFRLHLAIATTSIEDLYIARIALEGATAALAATHWTPSDLVELEGILDAMDATTDLPTFNGLDTDFHVQVAKTAQNPLIGDLTSAIREALRDPILEQSEAMGDWQQFRLGLIEQHREVFTAISDRNGALAQELMECHIRNAAHQLHLPAIERCR